MTFTGSGIDTGGGIFDSPASACTSTTTGRIVDLKSTDTDHSGGAVSIETDPFTPVLDPATCVSKNVQAVGFRVKLQSHECRSKRPSLRRISGKHRTDLLWFGIDTEGGAFNVTASIRQTVSPLTRTR
ncbi:MAG: hypothetical protein LC794_05135 [Acidobacteria bacterium]|nr:hypothetical protein [Acidobacteriota bacterium]